MEYSAIIGYLSRIDAVLQGEMIMVSGCQIGTLVDGRLTNMEGIGVDISDILSLNASPYGNSLAVNSSEGMFTLQGSAGEVYTIHDNVDSEMQYPTNPLDIRLWMQRLYPTLDEDLFFEELTMKDMVNMKMFGMEPKYMPIGDKFEDVFREDFQMRLNMAGVTKGSMVSRERFRSVLNVLTDPQTGHGRNLFMEWLESLEWDGTPRVRSWFKWSTGASAPVLAAVSEKLEDLYLGDVAEAWFVGTVRKQRFPIKHEVVPILIGQQGTGKSSIVNAIAFKDQWFAETSEHVTDPADFLESIQGAVVVELGESVQFDVKDSNFLKSFISKKADKLRLPYASRSEDFPRHFSFISTSNNLRVLTDPTGNRRYFPMYCDPDRSNFRPKIEYDPDERSFGMDVIEQLWAEAYQMEKEGRPHIVSERTKGICEIMQEYGTVENTSLDIITEFLDNPLNGYSNKGCYICKQIVIENAWGTRDIPEKAKEEAWKNWTDGQRDWKPISKQVRIGSIVTRSSYQRRFVPGERFRERILKADPSLADILDAPAENAVVPETPRATSVRSINSVLDMTPEERKDAEIVYSNVCRMFNCSAGDFLDPVYVGEDTIQVCKEVGLVKDVDGTGNQYILGAPGR